MYLLGVVLTASNCVFDSNRIDGGVQYSGYARGAAAFLNAGSAQFTFCAFTNNYNYSSHKAYGGVVFVADTVPTVFDTCVFTMNRSYCVTNSLTMATWANQGGVLYLSGTNLAVIKSCTIRNNGVDATTPGDIFLAAGTLGLTNTLLAGNWGLAAVTNSGALTLQGGTASVVNCTIAGNTKWGITPYTNGTLAKLAVKNCVVWGNAGGGINTNFSGTNTVLLNYSDSQETLTGTGNLNTDPLFVGGGDYHEQSKIGSWHGGLWTRDALTSPCIDKGDKADAVGAEPSPNGSRINMGAYGGTTQASKSLAPGTVLFLQ